MTIETSEWIAELEEDAASARADFARLEKLRHYVPLILAGGLWPKVGQPVTERLVAKLAEEAAATDGQKTLGQTLERLDKIAAGSKEGDGEAFTLVMRQVLSHAEIAFHLGIVVGQALGPNTSIVGGAR